MGEVMTFLGNAKVIAPYVFFTLMGASIVKYALDKIKDYTENEFDNKASEIFGKILGYGQSLLDVLGFNPEHLKKKK